jgi:hypothetical protein
MAAVTNETRTGNKPPLESWRDDFLYILARLPYGGRIEPDLEDARTKEFLQRNYDDGVSAEAAANEVDDMARNALRPNRRRRRA